MMRFTRADGAVLLYLEDISPLERSFKNYVDLAIQAGPSLLFDITIGKLHIWKPPVHA
jgi:hypothetical protein